MKTRLQQETFNPPQFAISMHSGLLQRKCACGTQSIGGNACTQCRKEQGGILQKSPITNQLTEELSPVVHEVLRTPGQPLDLATRAFFEPRFGYDFSQVRVHSDAKAVESAQAVNARAYTVGRDVVLGTGQSSLQTPSVRRLFAHELTHVIQQSKAGQSARLEVSDPADVAEQQAEKAAITIANGGSFKEVAMTTSAPALMRDLAQEPPPAMPEQRELTADQVQRAIRYNRASYDEESTRLIQDIVGASQTGRFDEETVRLVALIQRQFGLVPADGKVGPDTYDFLILELQAESVTPGTCLTMFQLVGPQPLTFFRTSSTRGSIQSRFDIHARFDPRCNCGDYEYRQFISGHVELLEAAQPGITPPATSGCAVLDSVLPGVWVWNMDGCFQIPGGGLARRMREDGDTGVAPGVAGRRYGHRSARPNPTDHRDEYLPDRATGCSYHSFDVPELAPVPATPADSGDVYDWDVRFRGVLQRSDGTIVSEKWWNIISTLTIP